jgi:hypothetical protein
MYVVLFSCMSLGFIARGCGLAGPSTRLSRAALLALLANLVCYVFVGFLLRRGCWVRVTMTASGLLDFCRSGCCALKLEGKSQVGITPICISSEGRMMPCHLSYHCCTPYILCLC